MTEEKICICNPIQSEIKTSEAIDFIRPDGKISARYHKDCDIHGYKIIETKEK